MSRLSRYLRQHRPGGWLSFLLTSTKSCNALLLLVGFAMFVYAGNLYVNQPGQSAVGTWPPAPPALPAVVIASMGLMASLAACAAQAAASTHSLVLLNIHLTLLALLLAGQVCLAAAVAAYGSSDGHDVVPDDRRRFRHADGGGAYDDDVYGDGAVPHLHDADLMPASAQVSGGGGGAGLRRELREVLMAYKWADAVALVVEVLTLVLGCMLHSAYMRADERAEDLEEGLADPSTPLLTSSRRAARRSGGAAPSGRTALPPRVTRDDPWSTRMREQYGLDTSMLSYNPQEGAARGRTGPGAGPGGAQQATGGSAGGAGPGAGGEGRCVIS